MKVAVLGANGRMGQEIVALLKEENSVEEVLSLGKNQLQDEVSAEVAIDFTRAESFQAVCDFSEKNNLPLVSGTTGITTAEKERLKKLSGTLPVLWAPNMSLGVAWLRKTLAATKELKDYDFQIVETHHIHKKDSPSGTAKLLQEALTSAVEKEVPEPLALRGGGVFGVHQVHIMGPEETLILEHQALNRTVFARGAVKAALWLQKQKPGLYSMEDVLEG